MIRGRSARNARKIRREPATTPHNDPTRMRSRRVGGRGWSCVRSCVRCCGCVAAGRRKKGAKEYGPGRIVPVRICMVRVIGFEPIRDPSREILSLLRLPISPYSHIYIWIFNCYAMQRLRLFVCRFRHTGAFLWDFCLAACGGLHGALPRRRRFFCAPLLIFFPCAVADFFARRCRSSFRAPSTFPSCGGFLRKIAPRLAARSLRSAAAAPFSGRQGKKTASASREAEADLLEAPPGFEPGSQGFAGPCLTTWL